MPDVMKLPSCTTNGSALARVKPYPQASALRLCSPSLRFVLSASLQGWANPLGLTLATPDLAGQAGVFAVSETQISISERNKFL
jgi:hypothetical protein